jgi:hypothetical protein
MSWKQPIPTDLETVFGSDWGCSLLYQQLIYRASNQDGFFTDDRKKTTPIKRGQVVFGKTKWSLYLQKPKTTLNAWLHKLSEIYQKVELQPSKNFTIVTIKDYDEIMKMEQRVYSNRTATVPSKSIESVKSEEKATENKSLEPLTHLELWEIAKHYSVSYSDVKDEQEALFLWMEDGHRKEVKSIKARIMNWVLRKKKEGKIETLSAIEMMSEANRYDPVTKARNKLAVEEGEKHGLDFSRVRKQIQ